MKNFKYVTAKSVKDASNLLESGWKDALPYAGGTDLLGLLKDSIESPESIVNLKSIPSLNQIEYREGKGLKIGTLVTISQLAEHPIVNEKFPVLAQAANEVASPQLRNVGTVGGNICQRPRCWYFRGEFNCLRKNGDICYAVDGKNKYHAIIGGGPCFIVHPSDLAVALMALEARVTFFSEGKNKQIQIDDFFTLPEKNINRENILKPGDLVIEIEVPEQKSITLNSYLKIKERGAWDFAVVSLAVVGEKDNNRIKWGRMVFGGVAPIPWFEKNVSKKLSGFEMTDENINHLADSALSEAEPLAMNEYKLYMARNLIKKLLRESM